MEIKTKLIMAYIATKRNKIGDWVITKKRHESMRGYDIEDECGNKMYEIGWEF